jgi:hypothetical protein
MANSGTTTTRQSLCTFVRKKSGHLLGCCVKRPVFTIRRRLARLDSRFSDDLPIPICTLIREQLI